jgi:hypothetical protein
MRPSGRLLQRSWPALVATGVFCTCPILPAPRLALPSSAVWRNGAAYRVAAGWQVTPKLIAGQTRLLIRPTTPPQRVGRSGRRDKLGAMTLYCFKATETARIPRPFGATRPHSGSPSHLPTCRPFLPLWERGRLAGSFACNIASSFWRTQETTPRPAGGGAFLR